MSGLVYCTRHRENVGNDPAATMHICAVRHRLTSQPPSRAPPAACVPCPSLSVSRSTYGRSYSNALYRVATRSVAWPVAYPCVRVGRATLPPERRCPNSHACKADSCTTLVQLYTQYTVYRSAASAVQFQCVCRSFALCSLPKEQPQGMQQELRLEVAPAVKVVEGGEVVEAHRMCRALQDGVARRHVRVEEGGARALDQRAHAPRERALLPEGVDGVDVVRGRAEDEARSRPPPPRQASALWTALEMRPRDVLSSRGFADANCGPKTIGEAP